MKNPRRLSRILVPLSIAFALLILWVAVLAVPGAWLITAMLLVTIPQVWLVAGGLVAAVILVAVFWSVHRLSGLAMLGGLLVLVLVICIPNLQDSAANRLAALAQLAYYRSDLLRQMEHRRSQGIAPATAEIAIDGFGSMTSGIALDPTGEILLPPDKRSSSWTATAGKTEIGIEGLQARHLVGDYYTWFHF